MDFNDFDTMDVTVDRDKYIGGSDIPALMGISPYKTRYELLLEKAGLKEIEPAENRYTEYGHYIEPFIRDYINEKENRCFKPNMTVKRGIRCHTDGFDGECVLEIKSTSWTYDSVDEYIVYLVQLLLYMAENGVQNGKLAVYERPDDFSPLFEPERLTEYDIVADDYTGLTEQVYSEIHRFEDDLARLKENPLLCEDDFQPVELVTLSQKAVELEQKMADFKALEAQYKAMKQSLFEAMTRYNVKSWRMFGGTQITRVDGSDASEETVTEFDEEAFRHECPDIFERYQKTVTRRKSGRAGYVKITLAKS